VAGTDRTEPLRAERVTKPVCFVVSPIGGENTEERKKSDQVLKHVVRAVLEPEYAVERADHIDRPGIITVQIVQRILQADLVVADLTDRNPNVYYELAIRHAAWKPTIHIISRGQEIPFDVQDMRVVRYDLADPDNLDDARAKLRQYTNAIQKGEPVITPVQFVQILQSLQAGEDRDRELGALFQSLNVGMSNLQQGIEEILMDLRQRRLDELWGRSRFATAPLSALGNTPVWAGPSLTYAAAPASLADQLAEITKALSALQKAETTRKSAEPVDEK
jgi:hypothetical protein